MYAHGSAVCGLFIHSTRLIDFMIPPPDAASRSISDVTSQLMREWLGWLRACCHSRVGFAVRMWQLFDTKSLYATTRSDSSNLALALAVVLFEIPVVQNKMAMDTLSCEIFSLFLRLSITATLKVFHEQSSVTTQTFAVDESQVAES